MSWFYQSQLWKYIQKEIYKKPTFDVTLWWKTYQWIMKKQTRLGKEFRWYMVHWITLGDLKHFSSDLKVTLDQFKRDHKRWWSDILFQIWSIDLLDQRPTNDIKKQDVAEEVKHLREYQQSDLYQRYWLKPSRREHMPNATIVLDTKTAREKKMLSESWKRYVNKWTKAELKFVELKTKKDREQYREMRYKTWYDKRFNVVPKETFLELMTYLKKEWKGTIFAAKKDNEIVSWAVYLFYGKQLIYLYWSTDRTYWNIWAQYRLTLEILKRAHKNKRTSLDLLGVAPVGYEKGHDLEGVTRFKQVFGGDTISYVGNYDIVFNGVLYKGFKTMKGK